VNESDLDVWLYGTRVAELTEERPGRIALSWTPDAQARWGRGARVLSAKLTIGETPVPPLVTAYLDGLLPEGNARANHSLAAGVPADDTFALIRVYGRDTPGAAIFVPQGAPDPTRAGAYQPLTDAEVAERLRRADVYQPASPTRTPESSTLPGMVPKITLHRADGQWYACTDGAPSTWILKRGAASDSPVADVVDTEVASLTIARMIGLTTIDAEIVDFGDVRAIAVSRYDRGPDNLRIHQEDLAQATGLNTADPLRKFQWGKQVPTLAQAAEVLQLDGGKPDPLLAQVTFSFLVGNTDMHAKNVSFLRYDDGSVALTPAYDVAMHLHHPRHERRIALDLNGVCQVDALTVEDVIAEGTTWGLPERRARRVVTQTVAAVAVALATIERSEHPGVTAAAWDVVNSRTSAASQQLERRSGLGAADPTATPSTAAGQVRTSTAPPGRGRRGPRRPR